MLAIIYIATAEFLYVPRLRTAGSVFSGIASVTMSPLLPVNSYRIFEIVENVVDNKQRSCESVAVTCLDTI